MKSFRFLSFFIVFTLCVGFTGFWSTPKTHAANWFTIYGGGVLSGKSMGDGIVDTVPDSGLPTDFISDVVQRLGSGNKTSFGSLISSAGQTVRKSDNSSTGDAFVKNTDTSLKSLSVSTVVNSATLTDTDCGANALKNLDPSLVYKVRNYGCFNGSLNSSDGYYDLTAPGLAIILFDSVAAGTSKTVTVSSLLRQINSATNERLLVMVEGKLAISDTVGTGNTYNPSSDLEIALVSNIDTSPGFEVLDSSTQALVIEGPLISNSDVLLGRNIASGYPGASIKYNPFYVAELSKKGYNSATGATVSIRGLLESKTTWRYD